MAAPQVGTKNTRNEDDDDDAMQGSLPTPSSRNGNASFGDTDTEAGPDGDYL